MDCIITGRKADEHHVWSRKAFPEFASKYWNKMPLSRSKHQEIHAIGIKAMATKYKQVKEWLENNGWYYDDVIMRWQHLKEK